MLVADEGQVAGGVTRWGEYRWKQMVSHGFTV